jgi:hypothetical protein
VQDQFDILRPGIGGDFIFDVINHVGLEVHPAIWAALWSKILAWWVL